jgi:uncharacterized membrane protein
MKAEALVDIQAFYFLIVICIYLNLYVMKFVSFIDLRQASGFLRVPQFPPPAQLTATI